MRVAGGKLRRRVFTSRFVLAGLLALVACTDEPALEADAETPPPAASFGTEPDVAAMLDPDRGNPPDTLEVLDLVEGEGEEAAPGTTVTVHYAGVLWADGAEIASTWDVDEPYTFELGAGRVIDGWELGVGGGGDIAPMREGGRRMVMIPPELAYGERGAGEAIGPDETLVYVVDLLDVAAEEEASPTP